MRQFGFELSAAATATAFGVCRQDCASNGRALNRRVTLVNLDG